MPEATAMTTTLYRGGRVYSAAHPHATAMLVVDATIVWLGTDTDAPEATTVVELDGALVTPAFVDAHVHTTDTGVALTGLDLRDARTRVELLDAVAAHCARQAPGSRTVVLGHGWDESRWPAPQLPTAAELDRASAGRMVYLSQASVHSALCSAALLAAVVDIAELDGFDPHGWLRRDAHHAARAHAFAAISPAQRADAQRATLRTAATRGIACLHECGGPQISGEDDFTALLALAAEARRLPEVYGYWGELLGARRARELGAVGAGGDLCADGALGARTAHLRAPYLDGGAGECGHGYLDAEQVAAHLRDCARHQMQGGFHAIGDQAIATVVAGFAAAATRLGTGALRAARHRVEHAELMDKSLIRSFVEYGVVASVQPAFDRLWGGEHQMYARRLGPDRSLAANPVGAMHAVGVTLAFGSDSPVTPLDPWGGVRAAMWHHNPVQRMNDKAAFAAHTRGGWRAVRHDADGVLAPGRPATFATWQTPAGVSGSGLPVLEAHAPAPVARRTVLRGTTIFDEARNEDELCARDRPGLPVGERGR